MITKNKIIKKNYFSQKKSDCRASQRRPKMCLQSGFQEFIQKQRKRRENVCFFYTYAHTLHLHTHIRHLQKKPQTSQKKTTQKKERGERMRNYIFEEKNIKSKFIHQFFFPKANDFF